MSLSDFIHRPLAELLPHAPPMILLDRLTVLSEELCEAELTLRPDSEFCVEGKVGAWIGIEYMAQTVAAQEGAQGLAAGVGKRVGLLLGTRSYVAHVPHFQVGATLRVQVRPVLSDESGLGVMACTLLAHPSGELLAAASLTVFRVEDLVAYLNSQGR